MNRQSLVNSFKHKKHTIYFRDGRVRRGIYPEDIKFLGNKILINGQWEMQNKIQAVKRGK